MNRRNHHVEMDRNDRRFSRRRRSGRGVINDDDAIRAITTRIDALSTQVAGMATSLQLLANQVAMTRSRVEELVMTTTNSAVEQTTKKEER